MAVGPEAQEVQGEVILVFQATMNCEPCAKEHLATWFCTTCQERMCDILAKAHKSQKKTEGHALEQLPPKREQNTPPPAPARGKSPTPTALPPASSKETEQTHTLMMSRSQKRRLKKVPTLVFLVGISLDAAKVVTEGCLLVWSLILFSVIFSQLTFYSCVS